ncbi:4305_t:CDS:2 [Diversispora eburnea]|uniref:4305_t:CDS:1 n=1 Tax=Diversispora eburnea TaxID=1213867 RepID=A0A9N8VVJ5_9GLOM|nr:4305_t:CDS:2 [Diversispora eburnea]
MVTSTDNKENENERIYNESNPFYVDTFQTPRSTSPPPKLSPFLQKIAIRVARLFGYYDLPIQALGVTRAMYQLCARQLEANREFYIDGCKLPDSFQTWFSITLLHVWMLMVRFRAEKDGKVYMQQLVNHLFDDAEWRMREIHGITSGRIITQYLKDYLAQFHGGVISYDEGLCKNDPVLAAALWRNVLVTEGSARSIASLVNYVRHELQSLDRTPYKEITQGRIIFSQKISPS